ncbi:MAG TPA: transcriptional repressor [Bacteroidia bacterium]|nr:transcriptional repressor [Sphingobacteriales bacterium]HPD64195.1 transcriptional repressor [Bacteroidia bacterium]HRS57935.1 transcriptional repressor [Bacteroidia bacterium]HRU67978.1 transcriptional repressor [Bacteroidia bacterium]
MNTYSYEEIIELFRNLGIRTTPQRLSIYQLLCYSKSHLTAEQIYQSLADKIPGLSLGTVYKTLDTLVEKGLVRRLKGTDDSVHFDADLDSHYHLFCEKTDKIMDYNDSELKQILDKYFESKQIDGFKIKEIQLNIIGETI